MPSIVIRDEAPDDVAATATLTREAFAGQSDGSPVEHLIVDALRRAGALTVSLVAESEGRVVGHVAVSPVTIADGSTGWFGLGPVSVTPAFQGQGIGHSLVQRGIERLRDADARGCVVVGEPAFYSRFGFTRNSNLFCPGVPSEYFMCLCFGSDSAHGSVTYHAAFAIDT